MSNLINTFVFPIIRQDFILPALSTLREVTPSNYNTIVVNQTKPAPEFEQELREQADVVVTTSKNYGFAQAANIGVRLCQTEYVTIANDDVIFLQGWWPGIIETFERFDNAIAVAPMSPKEPGWGYGEEGYRIHLSLKDARHPENIQRLREEKKGAVVDGIAMWMVTFRRKEWIEKVGLFDERFFPGGGEDYDMDSRIYQAGFRALSTSYSWIWHHWGQSKDEPTGYNVALPHARPFWNKLSTKGFGDEGLWDPDCDVWGKSGVRTDPEIYREYL